MGQSIQRFADGGIREPETPAHKGQMASAVNGEAEQCMKVGVDAIDKQSNHRLAARWRSAAKRALIWP